MAARRVNKSAPKWEFLLAVGLDEKSANDQGLYALIKSEAIRGHDQNMKGKRNALKPEANANPDTKPPFAYSQFTDAAIASTVSYILANASPRARQLYNRGAPDSTNWVIVWMLYNVCRFRDSRNTKARSDKFHDDDNLDGAATGSSKGPATKSGKLPYDPAREGPKA